METRDGGSTEDDNLKASDADRQQDVDRLGTAVGEGRLTLQECSGRAGQTYAARTHGELDGWSPICRLGHSRKPCRLRPRQDTEWFATPVGGLRRQGRWRLARHTVCVTLLGGMRLDLRQAELSGPDTMVTAVMLVGGARVIVPAGLNVQVSGFTLLGGRRIDDDQAAVPDAPVVRLRVLSHKPTHIGLPK
ncbi:MAG TPA: DUF1707 domain-containing protein [Pseudonocardiaceae bacterium]|nr:DUF1707 domain-containing protein [Pseudonocardiaceae bacterium]